MRIARGCLHLRMAKQLSDHRQALTIAHGDRGERMPKVVNAGVFQPGPSARTLPEGLQISEVLTGIAAGDDERVVGQNFDLAENLERGTSDMHDLRPRLGVRKPKAICSRCRREPTAGS